MQKLLYRALRATVVQQQGRRFPSTELVAAATRGEAERARTLLSAGADPDSTDGSSAALHRACANRHIQAALGRPLPSERQRPPRPSL